MGPRSPSVRSPPTGPPAAAWRRIRFRRLWRSDAVCARLRVLVGFSMRHIADAAKQGRGLIGASSEKLLRCRGHPFLSLAFVGTPLGRCGTVDSPPGNIHNGSSWTWAFSATHQYRATSRHYCVVAKQKCRKISASGSSSHLAAICSTTAATSSARALSPGLLWSASRITPRATSPYTKRGSIGTSRRRSRSWRKASGVGPKPQVRFVHTWRH